jgi:hypothetical protein
MRQAFMKLTVLEGQGHPKPQAVHHFKKRLALRVELSHHGGPGDIFDVWPQFRVCVHADNNVH